MNRLGECGIDEIGSLNSIVKLARGDLAENRLLVTSRKLSRMTTRVILLVKIDFPTSPAYSTLCQFYHEFDDEDILFQGLRAERKPENRRAFCRRDGSHGGGQMSRR